MATTSDSSASLEETDTRTDEMHSTIEAWINELVGGDEFQEWLDVQSRFHDYSHRNTLLIKLQWPEATKVDGFNTWRNEFDRHVQEGEQEIWIWAPIITKQCPECENSPSYHEDSNCKYDETPSKEWSKGLVGFKPAAVFDVSQTEGEPLPELEADATGDAEGLIPALTETADALGVTVRIVDENERSKREVEAETIAYIVGRFFGLDTSGSAFYLAAWQDDDSRGDSGSSRTDQFDRPGDYRDGR